MPLENSTTIKGLDARWPDGDDGIHEGDDHLRLIKRVLKAVFAGKDGQGLDAAIGVSAEEINYLSGVTGNIQAQIDTLVRADHLIAPKGTKMPFYQPTPPTGWTQDTTLNDRFLRVVSSGGATKGGSGGTSYSQRITPTINGHALTKAEMPAHNHVSNAIVSAQKLNGVTYHDPNSLGTWTTRLTWEHHKINGDDFVPNTSIEGSGTAHTHTAREFTTSWSPSFANVIIAVKD